MAVNFNQLLRRQSSREMVTRQFSRDVEARMEMNAMGDACHGRRIHYSGESFKIRQRSRSEVCTTKGQLISECLFEKNVWTKIPTKNLIDSAQQV